MIGASKLNEKDVEVIKYLFDRTDLRDGEIAEIFDVSRVHINRIRHGIRWNENKKSFRMKSPQPNWWNDYIEEYITRKIEQMIIENLGDE